MKNLTATEFAALCQSLVGSEKGWEDRAADHLDVSRNTVAKMAKKGASASMSSHVRAACNMPSGFEPTAAETDRHYTQRDIEHDLDERAGKQGR
ncbi:hypothetical protein [Henriciella sp.]|uniref:hypothetical protein n=1 Tax=Henriciella sp. TaxID=1968823 RepID=UPI00261F3902|nr:hypothetical protein [Henriciella sp.]